MDIEQHSPQPVASAIDQSRPGVGDRSHTVWTAECPSDQGEARVRPQFHTPYYRYCLFKIFL